MEKERKQAQNGGKQSVVCGGNEKGLKVIQST